MGHYCPDCRWPSRILRWRILACSEKAEEEPGSKAISQGMYCRTMFQFSQITSNSGWLDVDNEPSTHTSFPQIDEFTTTKHHMVIPQPCQCIAMVQHHPRMASMTTSLRMPLHREPQRSIRTRTSSRYHCQALHSRLLVPLRIGKL